MNGRAILRLAVSTALWLGTLAGVAVEPAVGPTVATLPPGLVWPESWLVYTDLQEADADLGALREAPAAIQGVAGRQVQPVKGRLSLLRPGEAATEKRAALVFGVVRSDRDRVVEMGCAAVLINSAVAAAEHPVGMAAAFAQAVQAGRAAYRAGLMPRRSAASATSPLTSFLKAEDRQGCLR